MNSVQRRLFRVFVDMGGDITDSESVERLIGFIDVQVTLMPPKVKLALELALNANEDLSYDELAAEAAKRERAAITQAALRQRVSRGVRLLEERIRARAPELRDARRSPRRRSPPRASLRIG